MQSENDYLGVMLIVLIRWYNWKFFVKTTLEVESDFLFRTIYFFPQMWQLFWDKESILFNIELQGKNRKSA